MKQNVFVCKTVQNAQGGVKTICSKPNPSTSTNEASEVEVSGHCTKKPDCCGEYVFDVDKREATPFGDYLLNSFTQPEVNFALSSLLPDPAQNFQFQYYLNGNLGHPQQFPVSVESMECLAKEKLGKYIWAYVGPQGAAGDGETYRFNLEELRKFRLSPKMAMGASGLPYTRPHTVNFGNFPITVPAPIFVAPMGVQSLLDPSGDETTIQAATNAPNAKISFCYSSASSYSIEEISAAGGANADLFFQMYSTNIPSINSSLISRAKAAGAKAIVLTLDTTKYAVREREMELGVFPFDWKNQNLPGGNTTATNTGRFHGIGLYVTDPVFNAVQASSAFHSVSDPAFVNIIPGGPYPVNVNQGFLIYSGIGPAGAKVVWDGGIANPQSIDWFVNEVQVKQPRIPLILKGILRVDDAVKAVQKGVSGIYVSNHGGRQVNGSVAAIDTLKPIADAVKAEALRLNVDKPAILFDSGIRRGADVVKAYALGAEWVGVGRPILYGLGAGGYDGVVHSIQTIMADIENTTQNMGYTNVALVQPQDVEHI